LSPFAKLVNHQCLKIAPIFGLVVYIIALLVPSMVQPFKIRGQTIQLEELVQKVGSVGANVDGARGDLPIHCRM